VSRPSTTPFLLATLIGCALIGSAVLPGCGSPVRYVFVDGLETPCDGAPCGWTVQSPTPGAARWNETLPGEHGVLLTGNPMAIVRDMTGVELEEASASGLTVELASRCDGEAELEVEIGVESLASGEIERLSATFPNPPSTWDGTLDARALTAASGGTSFFRDIVSLRIVKTGAGTCEVDYIGIHTQSFIEG
jgi:hypothetical protein